VTVDGLPYVGDYYRSSDLEPGYITLRTDDGYVDVLMEEKGGLSARMEVPVGAEVTVTEVDSSGYPLLGSFVYAKHHVDHPGPDLEISETEGEAGRTVAFTMPSNGYTTYAGFEHDGLP